MQPGRATRISSGLTVLRAFTMVMLLEEKPVSWESDRFSPSHKIDRRRVDSENLRLKVVVCNSAGSPTLAAGFPFTAAPLIIVANDSNQFFLVRRRG